MTLRSLVNLALIWIVTSGCSLSAPPSSSSAVQVGTRTGPPATSPATPRIQAGEAWIVFMWGPPTDHHIRLVRPDGSDEHALLPDLEGGEIHPTWAPSGDRIAFGHVTPGGAEQVWVVNADGSDARAVAEADAGCGVRYPDWAAPEALLFQLECAGPAPGIEATVVRSEIRRVELRSGRVTTVLEADFPWTVEQARLSPDGRRLAFIRFRLDLPVPDSALFVLDLDSKRERRLTDWELLAFHPGWVDDDTIVVNRHWDLAADSEDVPHDLYLVAADGTKLTAVTSYEPSGPRAAHPRAAADRSGIVFTHVDGPAWQERLMAYIDLRGERFQWLTQQATAGTHPQQRPVMQP